jgi:hypothetical protein
MIDGSHYIGVKGANMVTRSAYGIDLSIPMFVLIVDPKELGVLRMGIRVHLASSLCSISLSA